MRVPTSSIIVRQDYPPEEPEWSPAEYAAALAVKKFYEMGDADLTQAHCVAAPPCEEENQDAADFTSTG